MARVSKDGKVTYDFVLHAMTLFAGMPIESGRVGLLQIRKIHSQSGPSVTDPSHVSIGDTESDVVAKRGTPWLRTTLHNHVALLYDNNEDTTSAYEFVDGKVDTIILGAKPAYLNSLPPAPMPTLPDGTSVDRAIIDGQSTDKSAVDWEYLYLAANPCNGDSRWKLRKQSLTHNGARVYDMLDVVCPATGATRTFVFDITAGFGK
ncbi:MAG: hypothetical protein JO060_02640 [Candidatus Eremiobacteraeota bacterium]|nr:hypothetical protein [Candidatus Eremiobacteraeota bacterium]MBV9648179.1 hypothetical protein [Candidatus Eremiobacteraeota bacterium]